MKTKFLLVAALLVCAFAPAYAKSPKGHLVIIGGGGTTPAIQQAMIDYAGGKKAVLLAITNAGGAGGRGSGESFVKTYSKMDVADVRWAQPGRAEADDPEYVSKVLDGVTGIFFTGGQQSRIINDLQGTLLHRELLEMYVKGAMISGSSAGAAMMSDPMITGAHRDTTEREFKSIARNRVETSKGMGFIKGAIIDQHFIKRSRENRLFSLALDMPQYTYFGIDEATAIVISNGNEVKVVGKSNVMVVEPNAKAVKTNGKGDYGCKGMKVSLLVEGDTFKIRTTGEK